MCLVVVAVLMEDLQTFKNQIPTVHKFWENLNDECFRCILLFGQFFKGNDYLTVYVTFSNSQNCTVCKYLSV